MALNDAYDKMYQAKSEFQKEEICLERHPKNRFEAAVSVPGTGDKLLDIGCGNGYLIYQYRNRYRQLIGLEFSPERLRHAKNNLENINFIGYTGSAEKMSMIEDESIDRVIGVDVIEHIPDVYESVFEIFRVLKPGGDLIITTPNVASFRRRLQLLFGRFPSTSQPNEGVTDEPMLDGGHLHYFTYRSLRLVLKKGGFAISNSMGYGRLGMLQNVMPSLSSGGILMVARKDS